MVFSSLLFICIFLPSVLVLYNLSKNITYKNVVLALASLLFYAWGEPVWIMTLLFSSFMDYLHGRIMERWRGRWQAKAALLSSLILDLGILMTFKYSGFLVQNINQLLHLSLPVPAFTLPLGISFYTFQTLSYTIDVYRGDAKAQRSWLKYVTYLSMFPQLVAGPIVRYVDVAAQLEERKVTCEKFAQGAMRFVCGLAKKVLLANSAGDVVTMLLGGNMTNLSTASAWLGIIMYTFQIYFDFAGYSDMAIGMGKMLGFDFLENFNYPYISKSATEFWRRWHMSLGSFFRDYVYIPLGGNRHRHIRNILVVWFLTGFWHGASWNFILWGLYYGVILIIEKRTLKGRLLRLPPVLGNLYALILIVLGWALFYFTDFGQLKEFFVHAFGMNGTKPYDLVTLTTLFNNLWLIVACVLASTPLPNTIYRFFTAKSKSFAVVSSIILLCAGMAVCYIMLVGQTYNPFLYFRF